MCKFSNSISTRIIGFQIALVPLIVVPRIVGSQAATELSSVGSYRACLRQFELCKRNNDIDALKKLKKKVVRLEAQSNSDVRPLFVKLSSEMNEILKVHFEGVTEDILDKTGRLVMASQERALSIGENQTLVQVFELAAHKNYPHHEEFMLLKRAYDRANANRNGQHLARASKNNREGILNGVTTQIDNLQNNNNDVREVIAGRTVRNSRHEELPSLHKAAKVNNLDELISILQKGADVNGRDVEGNTPLHWAAINGHWKFIARLLLFNADRDVVNEKKETALQLAQENGHSRAIRVLKGETSVKNESDEADCIICCEDLDAEGQTLARISAHCLHMIHAACREQLIRSNRKTCPLCQQPIVDSVPIKTSIKQERVRAEPVQNSRIAFPSAASSRVVSLDGPQRQANPLGSIPPTVVPVAQHAVQVNRSPIHAPPVNRNMGVSLDPDMRLLVAASSGYVEGVCSLLNQGANVNFGDGEGITPLIAATIGGHYRVIEELLYRYNASADLADRNGCTALYWAAANGKLDIVRLLTEGRANELKEEGWRRMRYIGS